MKYNIGELFDYQRFENNPRLSRLISETLERYAHDDEGELSDETVELLNAAGSQVKEIKPDREKLL